jgi:hypothetical protein
MGSNGQVSQTLSCQSIVFSPLPSFCPPQLYRYSYSTYLSGSDRNEDEGAPLHVVPALQNWRVKYRTVQALLDMPLFDVVNGNPDQGYGMPKNRRSDGDRACLMRSSQLM